MGYKIVLHPKKVVITTKFIEYDLTDLIDDSISEFVLPVKGDYTKSVILSYNGLIQRNTKYNIENGTLILNFVPNIGDELILYYQGE